MNLKKVISTDFSEQLGKQTSSPRGLLVRYDIHVKTFFSRKYWYYMNTKREIIIQYKLKKRNKQNKKQRIREMENQIVLETRLAPDQQNN